MFRRDAFSGGNDLNMRVYSAVIAFCAALLCAGTALAWPQQGGHGGRGGHGGGEGTVVSGPYPGGPSGPYPYPVPGPVSPMPGTPEDTSEVMAPPPPLWFFCDKPAGFFPYVKDCDGNWLAYPVSPPPPGAGPPISSDAYEYCAPLKAYYPYVAKCPTHWVAEDASVPAPFTALENQPPVAQWFYCDESRAYLPLVQTCSANWRHTPAVPPPPPPKALAAVP